MNEDYLNHIDRLIRQRPSAGRSLGPYRELARLMMVVAMEQQPKMEHAAIHNDGEAPLFLRENLPVDFDAAATVLNRFLRHLCDTERKDRMALANALKQSEKNSRWSHRLFDAILRQDGEKIFAMGKAVGLNHGTLLFLGKSALKPSLETFRRLMEARVDEKAWNRGHCPLCGSQPDMARFSTAGKRFLHCELCGQEWIFTRVGCPFCSNRDQKALGYLEAQDEEGLRVYVCDVCRRYIKTIDARVFEEIAPLELESLATLHLDLTAQQNQYQ